MEQCCPHSRLRIREPGLLLLPNALKAAAFGEGLEGAEDGADLGGAEETFGVGLDTEDGADLGGAEEVFGVGLATPGKLAATLPSGRARFAAGSGGGSLLGGRGRLTAEVDDTEGTLRPLGALLAAPFEYGAGRARRE